MKHHVGGIGASPAKLLARDDHRSAGLSVCFRGQSCCSCASLPKLLGSAN